MNSKKLMSRLLLLVAIVAMLASSTLSHAAPPPPVPAPTLDPKTIVKWVNQLPKPPVYQPTVITDGAGNVVRHEYTIKMSRFMEQILPAPLPMTEVNRALAAGRPARDTACDSGPVVQPGWVALLPECRDQPDNTPLLAA